MNSEELTRRLMATFRPELEDHLTALNDGLLELEKGCTAESRENIIAEIFRAAHSLKGAARGVGLHDIESIAHALESILAEMKHGALLPAPELVDRLLPALDAMREAMAAHLAGQHLPPDLLRDLLASLAGVLEGKSRAGSASPREANAEADGPGSAISELARAKPAVSEPPTEAREMPAPESPPTPRATDTVRVSIEKLDALMEGAGELLLARMRSERQLAELRELQHYVSRWSKNWREVSGDVAALRRSERHGQRQRPFTISDIRPLLEFLTRNEASLRSVAGGMSRLVGMAASTLQGLALVGDTVQDSVRVMRMVPASEMIARFPRVVRDLAREQGKEISLRVVGADMEIDRWVLEAISDPLTHLLRNAVDHGIETPDEREASGKPRRGAVTLRVTQAGGAIIIEVTDDGAGIDPDAVLRSAIASKALTAEAASKLSRLQVMQLIFRSGVSTADAVTEVSGRGVGLDVVRANLERLRGTVAVSTAPGRGTTFTLTVPLTLATVHVLLAQVAGQLVALPTTTVERILRVNPKDVHSIDGRPAFHMGDEPVALFSLAQALELRDGSSEPANDVTRPTITVRVGDRRRAFTVDSLIGTQDVVVKSLGWPLQRVRNVAGCCILGGGEVGIVLNVAELMLAAPGASVTDTVVGERRAVSERRVLLVDDSITTRVLEKNILENAGFLVVSASDGEEAWSLIRSERPQLVVSDTDMPRLDGFELTRRIRADTAFNGIPVVLVTSLASPQDRLRGLEAGADAYITKGSFDQQELLTTIERLLG